MARPGDAPGRHGAIASHPEAEPKFEVGRSVAWTGSPAAGRVGSHTEPAPALPDGDAERSQSSQQGEEGVTLVEPPWCEPTTRFLLQWSHSSGAAAPAPNTPQPIPTATLEQVAAQVLRKAAVGASSVRLELGRGDFEGAELLITSARDGLDVRIQAPSGVDAERLGKAIERRLTGRGLKLSSVVVEEA